MNSKFSLFLLGAVALLSSCRKDNGEPEATPIVSKGIYVLNEGGFEQNNSSLSYFDFAGKVATSNIFASANAGASAGDIGNDVQVYGAKMYIIMNNSNLIHIVEAKSAKKIKSINMIIDGVKTLPRSVAFAKGKAFVSAYNDKVYVIDTITLAIEKSIGVGRDPEGLAVVGNKLYVANSGGLGYLTNETQDKTVSVIDLTTFTEIKKIEVPLNPKTIVADKYGDIYVATVGNYANIPANLVVIDSKTDLIKKKFDIPVTGIAIRNDIAYMYKAVYAYATNSYVIGYFTLNVQNETITSEKFITDDTDKAIKIPYGLAVDPISGDVFISDANDFQNPGTVYCFDQTGKKKYSFIAGIIPGHFAFYTK